MTGRGGVWWQAVSTSGLKADAYTGVVQAFRKIYAEEGLLAFWKGNGVNLIRIVPYSVRPFPPSTLASSCTHDGVCAQHIFATARRCCSDENREHTLRAAALIRGGGRAEAHGAGVLLLNKRSRCSCRRTISTSACWRATVAS